MKRKIFLVLKKLCNPTFIKVLILSVPIIAIIIFEAKSGTFKWSNVFEIKTFAAIILAFICQSLSVALFNLLEGHFEDAIKLTTDYNSLIKKYSRIKMFEFNNESDNGYGKVIFPIEVLQFRTGNEKAFKLRFDDSHYLNKYQLPAQIAAQSNCLMQAHRHSKIYNRLNIRLDDFINELGVTTLVYSQTYYYDSMITNRAMDYSMENGKTIREIYEPGPFFKPLKESKFSNHLGFNGFIELSDKKIIFVLRDKDLSIGKRTLACSVGASLKAEFALDDNFRFTKEGLNRAIIKEIKNELNIEISKTDDLTHSIFAFCRDILEGGRPQFIFYYKIDTMSSSDFLKSFKSRDKKDEKKLKTVDGKNFIFLSVEELFGCSILQNRLILPNKKKYKMMPLASGSVALLVNHIKG